MTFIVTQISSQQEKEELQKIFQELDEDGNGILSKEELIKGKRDAFGVIYIVIKGYAKLYGDREKAEAEVMGIIARVDVNNSGEIDFSGDYILGMLV